MDDLDYQYLADLVVKAQTGDSDSFAELYAATFQKSYRFALSYLNDEFLAQDAVQETYITALKSLIKLKEPTLFVSWLNQICFRTCFHMQKKQQRSNNEMQEFASESINRVASQQYNPESEVVSIDEKEYIIRQIMDLPFSESQVILLHYYKKMKLDEIAKLMGVSRSSVKRYLNNGRKRLSKLLV